MCVCARVRVCIDLYMSIYNKRYNNNCYLIIMIMMMTITIFIITTATIIIKKMKHNGKIFLREKTFVFTVKPI